MTEVEDHFHQPFYVVVRLLALSAIRLLYRWRVVGVEHIPKDGPVIIGSNHIHNFDPPVVGVGIPRYLHFMAKDELFRIGWIGYLLRVIGAFPVKRGASDRHAIRYALAVTQSAQCLCMFPEGHRSQDGKLGAGLTGVAFIARKANCPIVPAAVIGPYRFRRPLTVRFGAPIYAKEDDTNETLLQRLMQEIQKLLDEGHAK